jgi:hypothetical protein
MVVGPEITAPAAGVMRLIITGSGVGPGTGVGDAVGVAVGTGVGVAVANEPPTVMLVTGLESQMYPEPKAFEVCA